MKKIILAFSLLILLACGSKSDLTTEKTGTLENQSIGMYYLKEFYKNDAIYPFDYETNYVELRADSTFKIMNKLNENVVTLEGTVEISGEIIYFISNFENHIVKESYKLEGNKLIFESNIGDIKIKLIYEKGE